jgi:hypothetical protein
VTLNGVKLTAIKDHVRSARFRPFELMLNDGKILPVPHPDFILFTPTSAEFIVVTQDNAINILDAESVTRVRLLPEAKSGAKGQ